MRKLYLVVCACVILFPVHGQFGYGLQAGLNVATLVAKNYNNNSAQNQFRAGFNAGLFTEFRFQKHLSVKTALILETKGTNATYRADTLKADGSTRLLYLDLPLLIMGNIKAGSFGVFVNAGPYAGIGLNGKGTIETPYTSKTRTIRWGSGYQDDFKRLDYGIMASAGVRRKNILLEGSVLFGLANIYPLPQTGLKVQHRIFSLKLGYFFKNKG